MFFWVSREVWVSSDDCDIYDEDIILAKAIKILQRHMLAHRSTLDGTFYGRCIEQAIPLTLLQCVDMPEDGADI